MNGHGDDSLWDPQAAQGADPAAAELAALERALAPLRWSGAPAPERVLAVAPRRGPGRWWWLAAAAAALLLAWLAVGTWSVDGDPLRPGDAGRSFVAEAGPLPIALGALATVTLAEGGELELLHWRDDEARFRLLRGRIQADVAEPPMVPAGFFAVEVPVELPGGGRGAVTIVDRGCRFEVSADRAGQVAVTVQQGTVSVAIGRREAWLPAGSATRVVDGFVETPLFADASRDLQQMVRIYDKQLRGGGAADERRKLADKLSYMARTPHDALPLWHLLADDDAFVRKIVTEGLYRLAGAPDGSPMLERVYRADEWLPLLRAGAWR